MPNVGALLNAWTGEFAQVLEMMAGQAFAVRWSEEPAVLAPGALWWKQTLAGVPGAGICLGAAHAVWVRIGTAALTGAGLDTVEEADARGTWLEIVQQTVSGVARVVGQQAGRPIELEPGAELDAPPGDYLRFSGFVEHEGVELPIAVLVTEPLRRLMESGAQAAPATPATPTSASKELIETKGAPVPVPASRTMDVLLDVYMPVSISFGQAHAALRDVLKFCAGSVIELNRQPEDPVEVIVNNCVIARGEVVVVDGNYGVRIPEIVSRQQRLALHEGQGRGGLR